MWIKLGVYECVYAMSHSKLAYSTIYSYARLESEGFWAVYEYLENNSIHNLNYLNSKIIRNAEKVRDLIK